MLVVLSPAKTLDYESKLPSKEYTLPDFLTQSESLIQICRKLSPADIASLMKVSDKIASLNAVRFEEWSKDFNLENARQAIFAFKGDVYTGLDSYHLSSKALNFAQSHLRILSGLYGLLRPLDLMKPYRLEMGIKLENKKGKNLYQFWGDTLTQKLNQEADGISSKVLVNLASNEYFKAVLPQSFNGKIITPVFKDYKNGQYKVISFHAKKARGMMARFIMENQVQDINELKNFDDAGYQYNEAESSSDTLVFKRHLQD